MGNDGQIHRLPMVCILAAVCWAVSRPAEAASETKDDPNAAPSAPDGSFTHPNSAGWTPLLADDLSNATYLEGVWKITDGVLTATADQYLWTEAQYDRFVLDLEFKNGEGANSGVFVYASDLENFVSNSVEVQILDDFAERWADVPTSWRCGSIFGRLAPSRIAVRKPGEWNRLSIRCAGPRIDVALNGHHVVSMDMRQWTDAATNPDGSTAPGFLSTPPAELPTRGHIGLQGKHGDAPVWFRNIRIKELE